MKKAFKKINIINLKKNKQKKIDKIINEIKMKNKNLKNLVQKEQNKQPTKEINLFKTNTRVNAILKNKKYYNKKETFPHILQNEKFINEKLKYGTKQMKKKNQRALKIITNNISNKKDDTNKHILSDISSTQFSSANNSKGNILTDEERYPYLTNKHQNLHTDINEVVGYNDKILRNTSYKIKNDRHKILKGARDWVNATYAQMFYRKEPNKYKREKLYDKNIGNGLDRNGIMPKCIYNNLHLKYTTGPRLITSKGRKIF